MSAALDHSLMARPDAYAGGPEPAFPFTDRFRIERELGRGGLCMVKLAQDLRLGRSVALKRLLPALAASREAQERLAREAECLATLRHDGIVEVHDILGAGPELTLVLEYVGERDLSDELKETKGPLPLARTLAVVREVGSALAHVHERKIVHRDVKPGNILLEPDGGAKLIDFGLAFLGQGSDLTTSGTNIGTLDYMAPEQRGDASHVDARADVYGFAATIYACLVGASPRVIRESQIPEAFRATLLRALEERPERRFASVVEFVDALLAKAPEVTQQRFRVSRADERSPSAEGRFVPRPGSPSILARFCPVCDALRLADEDACTAATCQDATAFDACPIRLIERDRFARLEARPRIDPDRKNGLRCMCVACGSRQSTAKDACEACSCRLFRSCRMCQGLTREDTPRCRLCGAPADARPRRHGSRYEAS